MWLAVEVVEGGRYGEHITNRKKRAAHCSKPNSKWLIHTQLPATVVAAATSPFTTTSSGCPNGLNLHSKYCYEEFVFAKQHLP